MTNLKLIFDADGVVCTGGSFGVHLEREYGISPQRLAMFFMETFPHCLAGRKDLLEEIAVLLPAIRWRDSAQDFLEFWFTREHVLDERVVARVAELRQQG